MGAALARSGLGRRTALGTATLLIGANLPDVDVLAYLDGPGADLAFRRGWTHGVPALLVLPFVLTGVMLGLDRVVRRLGGAALPSGVDPRQVLLLASLAILTHPMLDMLNTYGVRWLMPLSGRWYYGDTLFIVDPWMWLILGVGVVLSRDRRGPRGLPSGGRQPARLALALATVYIVTMAASAVAARRIARAELEAGGPRVEELMVGPRLATPFTRDVVAAEGSSYQVGVFRWLRRPHIDPATLRSFPRPHPDDAGLAAARGTERGARFLGWARFPTVRLGRSATGGQVIQLVDLRYAERADAGFGAVTIPLTPK